jgi:ankyrin repeat protein
MVRLLLANNADVGHVPETLAVACRTASLEIVQPLLDSLRRVSSDAEQHMLHHSHSSNGSPPLNNAVKNPQHSASIVAELLRRRADVNTQDDLGVTPLMVAAERDSSACINLLVGARANVNAVDDEGQTALFYCLRGGSLDALELLLEAGAETRVVDGHGKTVLMADGTGVGDGICMLQMKQVLEQMRRMNE